jgi:hypothetical protein
VATNGANVTHPTDAHGNGCDQTLPAPAVENRSSWDWDIRSAGFLFFREANGPRKPHRPVVSIKSDSGRSTQISTPIQATGPKLTSAATGRKRTRGFRAKPSTTGETMCGPQGQPIGLGGRTPRIVWEARSAWTQITAGGDYPLERCKQDDEREIDRRGKGRAICANADAALDLPRSGRTGSTTASLKST